MRPFPQRTTPSSQSPVVFRHPQIADGARIHRIAADSKVLDTNTPYAYVLWCHDFAQTSIVADIDGATVGFVTGYLRPDEPGVVMVWQVAVDAAARGAGIAAGLLHSLLDAVAPAGAHTLQTTISPDNKASQRLFASVATDRGMTFSRASLFAASDFSLGDALGEHQPEDLYTLAP